MFFMGLLNPIAQIEVLQIISEQVNLVTVLVGLMAKKFTEQLNVRKDSITPEMVAEFANKHINFVPQSNISTVEDYLL